MACSRGPAKTLDLDTDKQITQLLKDLKVPGLSIAIIRNAKVDANFTFGFKSSNSSAPVDSSTVFEIGSMSKPVFAYAVMKLHEKRVLDLDTPLTKYTKQQFVRGDARLDRITARRVLSHTTGLPNWRSQSEPLKISFEPGERFAYSGEGYHYLQSVVTELTGHVDAKNCAKFELDFEVCATDFSDYMKTNVLGPFGMSLSAYLSDDTLKPHAAQPHDTDGRSYVRESTPPGVARYGAAGGLHSTPTDYAKFLIEVMDPKPGDPFRLKRETIDEMLRPHVKVDDVASWALGWIVSHTKDGNAISHGGENPGFNAYGLFYPNSKSGYVIMTNGENGGKLIFENLISKGVMDGLLAR
jgi:CubicO group peptidase (beta-lactamase class C family)